jgi:HK97 family phage major capsid protein
VPTTYENLIPKAVAAEVIQRVTDAQSALMALAQTVRMPTGVEAVPVISSAPVSGFVSPAYGGLKPGSAVDWTALTLTVGEIGVLVAVPDAYIADTTYDVWGSVKDEITKSFVGVFEKAALYGTNAPSDWPTGGLTAAAYADTVTGADPLAALDAAMSSLEQDGVTPTGILGGAALRAALRAQSVTILQPFTEAPASIYGVPIRFSTNWDDAVGLALVGGFNPGVVVGIREDMSWTLSEEGVITDATGTVILNALQSDSSILRAYWRLALQAVQPLGPAGSAVKTLALAKVGVARESRSKS